jgi:hypothetical protein
VAAIARLLRAGASSGAGAAVPDEQRAAESAAADSPLLWALWHRTLRGEPFSVWPFAAELYETGHPRVVVMKAAQVTISEWLVNLTLWCAASGAGGRGNVLYLMPTQGLMDDFVRARVDPAIAETPALASRRAGLRVDNVRLKRLGRGFAYFRAAESPRAIRSVDADLVILDEIEKVALGNELGREGALELAEQRLGSSRLGWVRAASTPGVPGGPTDRLWQQSDQRHFIIVCEGCRLGQALEWAENVVRDAAGVRVVCRRCRRDLPRTGGGLWVPARPGQGLWQGYHINKLYSPLANLEEVWQRAVSSDTSVQQQFYNQDLGLPWAPRGARLSVLELDACCEDYGMPASARMAAMGVDVGRRLHVHIVTAEPGGAYRTVFAGALDREAREAFQGEDGLDGLMHRYGVWRCVIDANPETGLARQFQARHPGRVFLAYYHRQAREQRDAAVPQWDMERGRVYLNRTVALDALYDAIRQGRLRLPREARALGGEPGREGYGELYRQLMAPVRLILRDAYGNPVARYVEGGAADHFAHAAAYALAAAQGYEPQGLGGALAAGYFAEVVARCVACHGPLHWPPTRPRAVCPRCGRIHQREC